MPYFEIDWDSVDDSRSMWHSVEPGIYTARLETRGLPATTMTTRDGETLPAFECQFHLNINGTTLTWRKAFATRGKALYYTKTLCRAAGVQVSGKGPFNSDVLHGRYVRVQVGLDHRPDGRVFPDFKAYLPPEETDTVSQSPPLVTLPELEPKSQTTPSSEPTTTSDAVLAALGLKSK